MLHEFHVTSRSTAMFGFRRCHWLWFVLAVGLAGCSEVVINSSDAEGDALDGARPCVPVGGVDSATASLVVNVLPQDSVTGFQVVNFAVPMPAGVLRESQNIEVLASRVPLAAYRRALARYPDGSIRSVQLQVKVDVSTTAKLTVKIGKPSTGGERRPVPITTTLHDSNGETGPRVWTLLPPTWLSAAGLTGPSLAHESFEDTALDAWKRVCDYNRWDTEAFMKQRASRGAWLYDRVTTMYRGYQVYGGIAPLSSGFREAHIYRNGLRGTDKETRIGVPTAADDVKYHYAQGLAVHYLLTGDDRFREAAENVADRVSALWSSPRYNGGADFWTERNAGFALLTYVWAATVSDDRAGDFEALADTASAAYIELQDTYPVGYKDTEARCFAHSAESHGEDYENFGCSPWMSAILAEALDAYANLRGGNQGKAAHASIVKLGRAIARDGIAPTGKPYYWMAMNDDGEADPDDEHWGEAAYVISLAGALDGKQDAALIKVAGRLIERLAKDGSAPHVRSFNWQCRSAVITPYYLRKSSRDRKVLNQQLGSKH